MFFMTLLKLVSTLKCVFEAFGSLIFMLCWQLKRVSLKHALFVWLLLNRAHRVDVRRLHQPSITLVNQTHFVNTIDLN
jgi:hypothetical protein